jgi:hypothetical protein
MSQAEFEKQQQATRELLAKRWAEKMADQELGIRSNTKNFSGFKSFKHNEMVYELKSE